MQPPENTSENSPSQTSMMRCEIISAWVYILKKTKPEGNGKLSQDDTLSVNHNTKSISLSVLNLKNLQL